ncbi:uncharacterized protein LOC107010121 isoform X2 [Solanum pennellii]|uniref:Uncharacterized protein LOC107010121 isoform X2 n=1 Tax=Solanum pennellii TaxID=28526 RepID=A0ABM1V3C8_SOLPN|nr:uncharacterized protein LOC107010121 isoform X2 [Solanum pennellii]
MSFHGIRRERVTPWKRAPKAHRPDVERESMNNKPKRRRFYLYPQNRHLDAYTNRAALTVSRSVVSLESYSGEEMIFQCSGTIVDSVDTCNIILTTASLLRCSTNRNSVVDNIKVIVHLFDGRSFDGHIESYDFHYNIAAIKIQLDTLLPVASLAYLNDSIVIDPSQLQGSEKKSFQLRPHSNSFDLFPGVSIIALGRLNRKPYDIMAAPGEFSIDRCHSGDFYCKELFMTTCKITICGDGGPLINHYGKIIGICFYAVGSSVFLPINIASIWWEHHKKYGYVGSLLLECGLLY